MKTITPEAIGARSTALAALGRALLVAAIGTAVVAVIVGALTGPVAAAQSEAVATTQDPDPDSETEPTPEPAPEDGGTEEPTAPEEGTDQADGGSTEPEPEPGDVPLGVWVAAGLLVLVAVVWSVRSAGKTESSTDGPE